MKRTLVCAVLAVCAWGMIGCGGEDYLDAAEQGDVDAQVALAHEYRLGDISDWDEAVKWFRKAAEQGSAEGQYNLGVMILRGTGVRQNSTEAVQWLRKAGEQGDVDAQLTLGQVYAGDYASEYNEASAEVAPDPAESEKWYRMAAEQGNAEAQAALDNL
jgi:TPR repeat protein